MPNLVQELGTGYFTDFFNGALFLHEGRLLQVHSAGSRNVLCTIYDGTGSQTNVPADFFQGYKQFEYPILGYRRLDQHRVSYLSRKQSTARGIRPSTINSNLTPATYALVDTGVLDRMSSTTSERSKATSAFFPQFDSLQTDLPELLAGRKLSLVLSPSIVIEPGVDRQDDWYNIYYKQATIGKMNSRGAVTWTSASHQSLLPELAN